MKRFYILGFSLFADIVNAEATLGSAATTLHGGATIISKLLWAACIIVGVALFFTSIAQYQIHRSNPKLVPLTTPITYFLLAFAAIAIPFAERIFNNEGHHEKVTIDQPIKQKNDYRTPKRSTGKYTNID